MSTVTPDDGDAGAVSIGSLAAMNVEQRWRQIVIQTRALLEQVAAGSNHWPVRSDRHATDRLAWALAFNLGAGTSDAADGPAVRSYLHHWPPQMTVAAFLDAMCRPMASGDGTFLSELLLSAGCEQRDDWQHPSCRPVDRKLAETYFACVYGRDADRVEAFLRSRFGERAGPSDGLANEAWARAFADYWSAGARRRFLGLSRIHTLVCEIGRYAALDALRAAGRERAISIDAETGDGERIANLLGIRVDPSEQMTAAEMRQSIKDAMTQLSARTALIAQAVWFQDQAAATVAKKLHVSESAISQQLKAAREVVRNYLENNGFLKPGTGSG